jgi:hypothetical protein
MGDTYRRVPGALLLLSANRQLETFRSALHDMLAELRGAIGPRAKLTLGVRFDLDPLAAVYGERPISPADAILYLAISTEVGLARAPELMSSLAFLAEHADPPAGGRSNDRDARRDAAGTCR